MRGCIQYKIYHDIPFPKHISDVFLSAQLSTDQPFFEWISHNLNIVCWSLFLYNVIPLLETIQYVVALYLCLVLVFYYEADDFLSYL